eukprot:1160136-Pelagomonas_calceolata.AAC.11
MRALFSACLTVLCMRMLSGACWLAACGAGACTWSSGMLTVLCMRMLPSACWLAASGAGACTWSPVHV